MVYPFKSITINNREVLLDDILTSAAPANTAFEQHSFEFIRRWFSGTDDFTLQTSGSTGPPKTIHIKRTQMLASAGATARALGLEPGNNALICLDPRYIAGQMMYVRCFNTGLRIIATDPTSNPLHSLPAQTHIDFTAVVPLQLDTMISSAGERLNVFGKVLVGGAAVSAETIHRLQDFTCQVIATYGMTETISHVALQLLNGPGRSGYFRALPGINVAVDGRGCLCVEVPYLEQSLITNDLVRLVSRNEFEWLGRIDNVINTGGVKVSPERIENKLMMTKPTLFLHDRLVISSRPNSRLGEEIVCVLEREKLDNEERVKMLAAFEAVLDRYEVPKAIICVSPFPLTKTGKIDRTALKTSVNRRL